MYSDEVLIISNNTINSTSKNGPDAHFELTGVAIINYTSSSYVPCHHIIPNR